MDGEFGKIMKQNELLAKENRLLDSYIYRKGRKGDDDQERFMRERKKGKPSTYTSTL